MQTLKHSLKALASIMNLTQQTETYPSDALREAAIMEGDGKVLNDRYTFEEYIARRGAFIGKTAAYSHLKNACFIARRHALEVFGGDEGLILSVQEVRRREIETQQDPLLPLPTETNTESIDSFQSYSTTEWTPATAAYHPRPAPSPTPPPSEHFDTSAPFTAEASMRATGATQIRTDSPIRSLKLNTTTAEAMAHTNGIISATLSALTDFSGAQSNALLSTPATSTMSDKVSETSFEQQTQNAKEVFHGQESALADLADVAALQSVTIAPSMSTMAATQRGNSPAAQAINTQQKFTVAPGVSALSRHGMQVPIKKRNRDTTLEDEDISQANTSDPISEDLQADNIVARKCQKVVTSIEDMALPAAKTISSMGKKGMATAVQKGVAQPVGKGTAVSKSKGAAGTKASANKTAPKTTNAKSKKGTELDDLFGDPPALPAVGLGKGNLVAVMNGDALPSHKQEAIQASKQRHARLLAAAQPAVRGRKTTKRKMNCMPEYFDKSLFDKNMEKDSVRCVCGRMHDDGAHMISCEVCYVWQHSACMLPGVTPKQADDLKSYLCHVCGPWEHREIIQRMRKAKGVV